MPVITIRGLTGSGASEIGRQVAHLIGGDYVDRQLIAEVAEMVERPEEQIASKEQMRPGVLARIVEPLRRIFSGSGKIESAYSRTWQEPLDDAEYLNALEAVIEGLALEQNMVIVGRGSQHILRNNQSVLHVLIVAPIEDRLNKVMSDMNVEKDEASRYLEETDSSRKAFVQRFFEKEIEDPVLYDLVINTSYIAYEAAARLVVSAASEKNPWLHG